jgi:ABC-2 type transport system permease protein
MTTDLAVLAWMRWRDLGNRFRLARSRSRFKVVVIAVASAAFWIGLYRVFHYGLDFVHRAAGQHQDLVGAMLDVFFFALAMMLVFSNGIISYSSLYRSQETGFLLAAPVRPGSIFLYKIAEALAFSSWAFLFLASPLLAAYGRLFDLGPSFYAGSALFLAAFVFIPAPLGAMIAMLVTSFVPRTRRGLIVAVAGAIVLGALVVGSKLLTVRGGPAADLRLVMEVFDSVSFTRNPLLPSFWISQGIRLLKEAQHEGALFFLGVIVANGAFLMSLAHWMSSRLIFRGWFVTQGLRRTVRYAASGWIDAAGRLLVGTSPGVRLIVVKDLKGFIRDPVQWSQFLIFFGLLGIYFLNLRSFAYSERDVFWKMLIAQLNLLATSLTLATFSSRFIFPQLSLEGRRFWVIGMVPMERDRILFGKLALSFFTSLAISETLIAVSSFMLRTPAPVALLHAVALFGICLGLSGLAVGLGAVYPNFAEDNPSKIVSGFGGTLNLVVSLAFVVAVLALQAVPCLMYFGHWSGAGPRSEVWIVGSMAGIAIVSIAACLLPMNLGLKALRRLEI